MSSPGLAQKHILLTRSVEHLPALDGLLRARHAIPLHFPCLALEILPAAVKEAADAILSGTGPTYSDVVFTSSHGVHSVITSLQDMGISPARLFRQLRVAAVGNKTAQALQHHAIHVDIIPARASQDGLLASYIQQGLPRALLFFRAEEGRDTLIHGLEDLSVSVTLAKVYRTACPQSDAADVIAAIARHEVDAVLLASPKTMRFYIQRIGSLALANRPVVVVISDSLATAARNMGLHVQVVAKHASFEAMLDALAEYYDTQRSS